MDSPADFAASAGLRKVASAEGRSAGGRNAGIGGGMSFNAFEIESQNRSPELGKAYAYEIENKL